MLGTSREVGHDIETFLVAVPQAIPVIHLVHETHKMRIDNKVQYINVFQPVCSICFFYCSSFLIQGKMQTSFIYMYKEPYVPGLQYKIGLHYFPGVEIQAPLEMQQKPSRYGNQDH